MSKVASRLLVFFFGIPIVIGIVIWPVMNHLPLHVLICFAASAGACELWDIFSKKHQLLPKKFIVTCSSLIAVVAGLNAVLPDLLGITVPGGQEVVTFVYILTLLAILYCEVFNAKEFSESIDRIVSSAFVITYTGFLMTFISRMTVWKLNGENP